MDINKTITRRRALQITSAGLVFATTATVSTHAMQLRPPFASTTMALADLERRSGGRLGVALLDTASAQITGHRLGERFAMCSTFKLPLAGAILREVDQGHLRRDQWVAYGPADMVSHAPVTSQHLARGGMTVAELAEATQTTSDNPAANLLLKLVGGPPGLTAILRTAGDTTTPTAMAHTTARMLTGDWLSAASRETLTAWMVATTTGKQRIRAGLPKDWRAGDKTGTATAPHMRDKYNDIAIAWPPGKTPLVITAFLETRFSHPEIRDEDQAVLAEVGRIAARWSRGL
jgi:beta-lactamase class A